MAIFKPQFSRNQLFFAFGAFLLALIALAFVSC